MAHTKAMTHILDNYDKVFLIRIGHNRAGFFAYLQWAINQIRYCEKHNYLPVVHYDSVICSPPDGPI